MKNTKAFPILLIAMCWIGTAALGASSTDRDGAKSQTSPTLPPYPEAIASFGAAVSQDHLYVFGGHIGRTHQHSIENLSHSFRRLDLSSPETGWQELGSVPGLQGLPLVSADEQICRIGGLSARNHQDEEPEDLISVSEVRCFEPESQTWADWPALPAGRSSHDAAVLDGKIFAVGGWQLRGADESPRWHDTMAVLDLSHIGSDTPDLSWRAVPQPFQRRALAVAAAGGKIFALGGLSAEGTSRRVDIYDPASDTWSVGPDLPAMAEKMKGFGVSAFGVGDQLFVSGADGRVHVLETHSLQWREELGQLDSPRFFHRLLPHGDRLLFIGGASREGHLSSLESLAIDRSPEPVQASAQPTNLLPTSWPGFRGHGDGRSKFPLPLQWSEEQNLAWRSRIPGYGQSAPSIWGDLVFVTSVDGPNKESLILTCLSIAEGEVLWRRRFESGHPFEDSTMVSRGAPTPVVDAQRVYAFWETGELIALDHLGETLWRRSLVDDFGPFLGNHGIASSPVSAGDSLVIQITHDGPSYFLAVDKENGKDLWKQDRPPKVAWTTPTVIEGPGGLEIVSSAAGRVEALRVRDGKVLWSFDGIEKNHVPSALVHGDRIIVPSSQAGQTLALSRDTTEPLFAERILWRAEGIASGFGSPSIAGDCVLLVNKSGGLSCLDQSDGRLLWRFRMDEGIWASPIVTPDRVYFFTQKGHTVVLQIHREGPTVLAENLLPTDDTVYGVAAAPGAFLIRMGQELVRVGLPADSAASG